MSYNVFFSLAAGLRRTQIVPRGTLRALQEHVAWVERELQIEVETYRGETRWRRFGRPYGEGVSDATLCAVAMAHNRWVRELHRLFGVWAEARRTQTPPAGVWERRSWGDGPWTLVTFGHTDAPPPERLTPKQATTFWRALHEIDVPPERWTADYYRNRMEHLYEVLRGRPSEGVSFDARTPLTPEQAAGVIVHVEKWLDRHELLLDVPRGRG